jgi:hypothetical protein
MSGGYFDYNCYRISQFAEDLRHELDINNSIERDHYGETIGRQYEPETVAILTQCLAIIDQASKVAREIEWLYSGDHGEESFRQLVGPMLEGRDG